MAESDLLPFTPAEKAKRQAALKKPGLIPGVEGALPKPPKIPVKQILMNDVFIVGGARG